MSTYARWQLWPWARSAARLTWLSPLCWKPIQDSDASVRRRAGIAVQELIHANPVALMMVQARLSTATPELRQQIQAALQHVGASQAA